MAQYTPGIWRSAPGITSGREVLALSAPKSKRVIARCGGPDRDANASLIAAAPDLFDAAENALEALTGCCIPAGGVDDEKAILDARRMLRMALDLAKGEPA